MSITCLSLTIDYPFRSFTCTAVVFIVVIVVVVVVVIVVVWLFNVFACL